jgi:hypothetical protein
LMTSFPLVPFTSTSSRLVPLIFASCGFPLCVDGATGAQRCDRLQPLRQRQNRPAA